MSVTDTDGGSVGPYTVITNIISLLVYKRETVAILRIPPSLCVETPITCNTAVQSQKAVSAYFTSKQILPFGFAEQNSMHCFVGLSHHFLSVCKSAWTIQMLFCHSGPALVYCWASVTCPGPTVNQRRSVFDLWWTAHTGSTSIEYRRESSRFYMPVCGCGWNCRLQKPQPRAGKFTISRIPAAMENRAKTVKMICI